MTLPDKYKWLTKEGGPKMIVEALRHYGTLETKGKGNNPDITKWADEIGGDVDKVFVADEIPWCGLFMAIVAKRTGKPFPAAPLWALNWGNFGKHSPIPMLGDVLVFVRKTSTGARAGHVGLYVGEDSAAYHVLGGNQSDAVTISRIAKNRLYTARRPVYTLQPANVRKIILSTSGVLSTNEA
jgi:uncharacterized protein (TIGR02594 family)